MKCLVLFAVFFVLVFSLSCVDPVILNKPVGINDFFQISIPNHYEILMIDGAQIVNEDRLITFKLTKPSFSLSYFVPGPFFNKREIIFTVDFESEDKDKDGFPDSAELIGADCQRFRNWMVWIAKKQKNNPSPVWLQRDCSGLIRFSMIEALKRHDSDWINRFGSLPPNYEDIRAYSYPDVPVLGSSIFLTYAGFHSFADARNLLLYNCERKGYDLESSKMGDLLFFYHPQDPVFPYHMMMITDDGFVYHTGPDDESEGSVRLWKKSDYLDAAPLIWLPVKENPNFLGVYQLKILND